ncbi:MAG: CotH kinase family protein, partial [Vicinamibacterales bacterium]
TVVTAFPPPGGGRFGARATADLDPLIGMDDATKPLRSKLLAVPALRARYLACVRDIAQRWLDWKKLGPMLAAHQRLIAEEVKLDTRKLYSYDAFQAGLDGPENSLKSFVEARRAFLLNFTDPTAGMK